MLKQIKEMKSYSQKQAPIVAAKTFPTLLFAPGFCDPAELYENFITELVSQGYIVVGINTPFINRVALPNEHIVQPVNIDPFDAVKMKQYFSLQVQDMTYVLEQIKIRHELHDTLFSAMDLQHLGAFGHSIGAGTVAEVAHAHPDWLRAAATFDVCNTQKKFAIPFIHVSAAKTLELLHIYLLLGKNNYSVVLSKDEQDHDYSTHMNLSDESTLQYLPAYQMFLKHYKGQNDYSVLGIGDGWDISNSINIYLVKFFDMFLKGKADPAFVNCSALAPNTYMRCGN